MKAIETTGKLDAEKRLVVNTDLSEFKDQQMRVIILVPDDEQEISEQAWLQAAEYNASFAFLKDEPNLYSHSNGKPFHDQG